MSGNGHDYGPEEETTPVELPIIPENIEVCRELSEVAATFTAIALEVTRLQRDTRRNRTPYGGEVFATLAQAFEIGRAQLASTIAKFQTWALKTPR